MGKVDLATSFFVLHSLQTAVWVLFVPKSWFKSMELLCSRQCLQFVVQNSALISVYLLTMYMKVSEERQQNNRPQLVQ